MRPGIIHGGESRGLFCSLTNLVARLRIVPLPGRGDQVLYLAHIDDLAALVERMLHADLPPGRRLVTAACSDGVTLREILERISNGLGRRRRFLPVPSCAPVELAAGRRGGPRREASATQRLVRQPAELQPHARFLDAGCSKGRVFARFPWSTRRRLEP